MFHNQNGHLSMDLILTTIIIPTHLKRSAKEYEFGYQKSALDGYWVKKIKGVDVKWKQGTPLPVDYKDWKSIKKSKMG